MLPARSVRLLVVVGLVVLPGCGPEVAGAPAPSSAPVAATAVVPVPAALPDSVAPGLRPVTGSTGDPRDARYTSVLDVPGVPGYQDVASAVVDSVVADYTAQLGAIADPQARYGRLTVTSSVVAAGGSAIGLRVASVSAVQQGTAAATRTASTAYLVVPDGDGPGEVVTSPQLLTDAGRAALTEEVRGVLGAAADPTAAVTDDLRVRPDGAVVAVLSPGSGLTDPGAGDVAVEVPAARVSPWLSAAGRRITDQLTSGEEFTALPGTLPAPPPVDCAAQACIALTFDDGPGPYTGRLLDELAAAGVPATFFVVGQNVVARPDLVARAVAEGHEVANHSWDHPQLTTLTAEQVDAELDRTGAAIAAATGGAPPTVVRPPYGDYDDAVLAELAARGEAAVTWDVDTRDWQNRDAAITTQRALDGAVPGSIVLMHDIHPSTVDAVPGLITQLQQRGFTFVTVSQLLGTGLTPGTAWSRGPEH